MLYDETEVAENKSHSEEAGTCDELRGRDMSGSNKVILMRVVESVLHLPEHW